MPNRKDRREGLRVAVRGGVLLRPATRGTQSHKVRNVMTERVLPCCYDNCAIDGDTRIDVKIPHPTPRWKNPATGEQEMLVYIFCSDAHKAAWLKGSPYENRA